MRRLFPIAALVACLSAQPALAEAKPAILILEMEGGGLPAALVRLLDEAMRAEVTAIRKPGMAILPKPALDFDAMKLAAGCIDDGPACLTVIGQTLGAAEVLQATVVGDISRATVRFLLLDVATGKPVESTGELTHLDHQSAAEMRVLVASAFGVKRTPPPGRIALQADNADLSSAEILLDDRMVDRASLGAVTPGEHRLEIRTPDHETFIWLGMVRTGRQTDVRVELQATTPPPPVAEAPPAVADPPAPIEAAAPSSGARPRIFTWLLGGSALIAATVGGLHAIQVNDQESQLDSLVAQISASCEANGGCGETVCDVPDPPAACSSGSRAATISNVSFALTGALAVGAIVAYFVEAPDEPAGAVEVSGTVAPTADGAAAALRLRF